MKKLVLLALSAAVMACAGGTRMPKGPPPEYEVHDAGNPVFEGSDPQTEPRETAVPTLPAESDAGSR